VALHQIHHERDMHEEQQYVCMAQTSNNKRLQHMISIAACCHSVKLCALAACVFGHFGHATWPRAQPLDGSILTKFSLETWLESASFETLMDFLAFLVQKLRSEINKVII